VTFRYRPLGGTGIEVSSYYLGTMMFGSEGNTDVDECIGMIHTVLDAGINFVDTADAYGEDGGSEQIVESHAVAERRGLMRFRTEQPPYSAVTSVILGPRTPQQLDDLLAGSNVELDDKMLDRIDEIVPPGTDLVDITWKPPALTEIAARRRPMADRAASN
jgi:aryl-alcohol dehydrogenase-like predicted oxidoreductase